MRHSVGLLVILLVVLQAGGCNDRRSGDVPAPQELTRDAVGYFCGMTVLDHKGPKGQIFLADREQPLWFTSVRDTIAFTRLPGEAKNIAAIYVTDAGRTSWDAPEKGAWIDAHAAYYVLGSDRIGGMQKTELVPFADRQGAERFIKRHGGVIAVLDTIPQDSVLEHAE